MILLSNTALFQKEGGQSLIGGLDVEVCRNFFGAQVQSFEMSLNVDNPNLNSEASSSPAAKAVFIRAPAILRTGSWSKHN